MAYKEGDRKQGDIMENPANRRSTAIVLIVLGVVFLLSQTGVLNLQGNWWAIFIAIPAVIMLNEAYKAYGRDGRITQEVGSNLIGGSIVGVLAVLAGINQMQLFLPLVLIAIGIGVAFGWTRREHR